MLNFDSFRTFFLHGIFGFGGISGLVVTRKSYMLLWDLAGFEKLHVFVGFWDFRDLKSYMFSWDLTQIPVEIPSPRTKSATPTEDICV